MIASGASHDRFSANNCTSSAVPTSAPSIIASAAEVTIIPCPTNDEASSAVAVELCSSPVTPNPAAIDKLR